MMPMRIRKRKTEKKTKTKYGPWMTVTLAALIVLIITVFWSIFISGPARIHEAQQAKVEAAIKKEVPGIKGLEENKFEYVTWQGFDDTTLYWFDNTGKVITTRPMETLDYDKVRENAGSDNDMDVESVSLAYGYDGPVYLVKGSGKMLMLDYDTLKQVYERSDVR